MAIATIAVLAALAGIAWRSTRRVALLMPDPRGGSSVRYQLQKLEARGLVERRGVFPMWRRARGRA